MMFFFKKSSFSSTQERKRNFSFESLEAREMLSATGWEVPESPVGQVAMVNAQSSDALSVTKTDSNKVTLSWDASQMAGIRSSEPFKIEQLTIVDGKEVWKQIGSDIPYNYTIGKGIYNYDVSGLDASTEYIFRISYSSTGTGVGYSNRLTVRTLDCELRSEALSSSSVKLSWEAAGKNGTYYQIFQQLGSEWVEVGKVRADGTDKVTRTFTVSELESGTHYSFKIAYYNLETEERESRIVSVQTLFELNASDSDTDSVRLGWDSALGGSNHVVQICAGTSSPNSATNWSLATSTRDGNSFNVTGLKENTSYYFRVRYTVEVDGVSETRYTQVLAYSTPSSIEISQTTESSFKVSWTFTGKSGTVYYIQTSLDGQQWTDYPGANTTGSSYTLSKLQPGTDYHVRVRYTSTTGEEVFSAPERVTTRVKVKVDSVTENSATIAWDIANRKPGSSVQVQRCDNTLDPTVETNWKTIASGITGDSYTNENLGSDKQYYYRVEYTDTEGRTQYTVHVSALTGGVLRAEEPGSDSVELNWNFVPKQGSSLKVQIAQGEHPPTTDAGWGELLNGVTLHSDASGCTVTGLTPGRIYYFRIVYTSAKGGEESVSTVVTVRTMSDNLLATETGSESVRLQWAPTGFGSDDASGRFVVYKFEHSDREGAGQWVAVTTLESSARSYTVTGLLADTIYQFKIEREGSSAVSSVLSVKTSANELLVSNVTQNSGLITWNFDTDKDAAVNKTENGDGGGTFVVQKYVGPGKPGEAERTSDDPSMWIDLGEPNDATQKRYNVTGLESDSTQYYRVVYTYRTGDPVAGEGTAWIVPLVTKYSAIATITTQRNIKTTFTGINRVMLQWDSQSLPTGGRYTVQRSLDGKSWTDLGTTASTSYDCSNLAADTTYYFRVLYGDTGVSHTVTTTTGQYSLSLTNKQVDIHSAGVSVEMKYLSALESDFVLYYRLKGDPDAAWTGNESKVSGECGTYEVLFNLNDLKPETEYEFKVVYRSKGTDLVHESETLEVVLRDDLMPSNVNASSVTVSWDASEFLDRLDGSRFVVQWRESGSTSVWSSGSSVADTTSSYKVTGLDANKDYEFRVQYVTPGNATAYSATKTVRTTRPEIATSAPRYGNVKLNWSFASVDGYTIQYRDARGEWVDVLYVSDNHARETVLSRLGELSIESETEYVFRIAYQAVEGGETVYSEESTVSTLFGLRVKEAGVGSTTVTLEWDYSTDNVFKIQYREAGTGAWAGTIGDIDPKTQSYTIKDLDPGIEYEFILTYTDLMERTVSVTAVTGKVAPEAPSGISVANITSSKCVLKWTDNSVYETHYVIQLTNNLTGEVREIEIGAGIGIGPMEKEIDGLLSNTSYNIVLRAKNTEGESASISTKFTTAKVTSLSAVKTVKALTTAKSITLTWAVNSQKDVPDPTQFRIEYYDPETKLWYEVTTVENEMRWTASGSFTYGADGTKVTLENKTGYQFRIVALGFVHDGDVYGDAPAASIKATTATLTAPTPGKATNVTMTSTTVNFTDSDKNVDPSKKTYQVGYVAGKYSDWSKVDPKEIVWITVPAGKFQAHLTGLIPETTYTYIVSSEYSEGYAESRVATFTTSKMVTATDVKGGFTLNDSSQFAFRLTWQPPKAGSVSSDLSTSFEILVSDSTKKDSFVKLTVPESAIKTLKNGLKEVTLTFKDVINVLENSGVDLSRLTMACFQVQTVYSKGGEVLSSTQSTTLRVTLPKLT